MIDKLPEKWCVKGGNPIHDVILKGWRGGGYNLGDSSVIYLLSSKFWCYTPEGYTEITFEEFERFVLNKEVFDEPNLMKFIYD